MSPGEQPQISSPWPHRVAVVLCCATFPLIWVGGLVTTYDAGMAVPDWPTTFGYNLFLYPWQTWVFGPFDLFIEHGHRLLGAAVGLLAIGLVAVSAAADWRSSKSSSSTRLLPYALVAFGLVLTQGILGGLRVQLDARGLAMLHGCFGLATFGYLCAMTAVTSQGSGMATPARPEACGWRCPRLALWTTGLIYLQIVFGAFLRHVPVGSPHQFFRLAVLFHLLIAVGVVAHVFLWSRAVRRNAPENAWLLRPLRWLTGLVVLQISLGVATWVLKYGWPGGLADWPYLAGYTIEANSLWQATVTTAHVATGGLILGSSVIGSLRTWRFFRPAVTAGSSVVWMGWTT